jgi:HEAT repeat protein
VKAPDAACRAEVLKALGFLAALHAPESEKLTVLRQILAATRDEDAVVRAAAVGSLASLAGCDMGAVVDAIRSALADPSVDVREAAAWELGWLGVVLPEAQPDAASILMPLLAGRDDPRVRVKAAQALSLFGVDGRRHPPGAGPDVAPALAAALRDPEVDVRRAAAAILGLTTRGARGRAISAWDKRKDSIVPALDAALSDDDEAVREDSALALFALGRRAPGVVELIEQAARDPNRPTRSKFELALRAWEAEQEVLAPAEPPSSEDSTP